MKVKDLRALITETKNNKELRQLTEYLLYGNDASNEPRSVRRNRRFIKDPCVLGLLESLELGCKDIPYTENRAFALSQLPDLNLVIADTLYKRPVYITAPNHISSFYRRHMQNVDRSQLTIPRHQ